jgi:hypothetical protein
METNPISVELVSDNSEIELESVHDFNAEEVLDVSNGSIHSQIKEFREQSKFSLFKLIIL